MNIRPLHNRVRATTEEDMIWLPHVCDDADESIRPRELVHIQRLASEVSGTGPLVASKDALAKTMRRAQTMLEMCELHDMVRLGEEMAHGPRSSSRHNDDHDHDGDDDDGFYIDSSDETFSGVVPEAMAHPSEEAKSVGSGGLVGGMRRSKSAASLTSSHRRRMIDLLEVDDEKKTQDDLLGKEEQCSASGLQPLGEESCVPLNDLVDEHPADINKTDHCQLTTSGHPSHSKDVTPLLRSSSGGMPVRSCLKTSSNSLGSVIDGGQLSINSANSPGMKRNVSFSSIEIRSYNIILGDAPTANGPAISLDWNYDPAETRECKIDAYENEVSVALECSHQDNDDDRPRSRIRREKHELWMPPSHRQYLLMREWGYSRGEIEAAMKEAQRASQRRAQMATKVQLGFEEALEKVRKKVALVGRSLKRM